MQSTHMIEERDVFGRDIVPEINTRIQETVACADDFERARDLFYRAWGMQPDQLEVYIALSKVCFYRGHLEEAKQIVLDTLQQSAQGGGFSTDWLELDNNSTDWTVEKGPAQVYLYSLKALAVIRLRKGELDDAREVLTKLQQLNSQDLVGASVIVTLTEALLT